MYIPLAIIEIDQVVDAIGHDTDNATVARQAENMLADGLVRTSLGALTNRVEVRDYISVYTSQLDPLVFAITDTHVHVYLDALDMDYNEVLTWVE